MKIIDLFQKTYYKWGTIQINEDYKGKITYLRGKLVNIESKSMN